MISLGCAKNLVDSENMLGILRQTGFSIASNLEEAGIAVINTCGFIQSAAEESIDTIFEILQKKNNGKIEKLFVAGCLVQRYGNKLRSEILEVDGWLGTGEIYRIAELLEQGKGGQSPFFIGKPVYLADHNTPRIQTTPFHSAYLKIAEGCPHRCSFCTIPRIRGRLRSREIDSLMIEARQLVSRGVKEISLVAQDTTAYGKDRDKETGLEDLLEEMLLIRGLRWIRILYSHPLGISGRLLRLIEHEEAICPYLDLPLQHINDNILKGMGRKYHREDIIRLIGMIRDVPRRISMRTTLMVGFPGETEDIYRELYDFVEMAGFDHLGVFIYSPEQGTRAERLKGVPGHKVAEERLDEIMRLQADIALKNNMRFINQTLPVLIEGFSPETELLLSGRTATMAPDVDGRVLINKGQGVVGEIVPVLISEAYAYDLVGEVV